MMDININAQGLAMGPAEKLRIRLQLEHSLRRFASRIRAVDLYLKDINGPRNGKDKNVIMRIRLTSGRVFAVRALRSQILSATRLATKLAKRRIKKAIRMQQLKRRPMASPGTTDSYAAA